MNSSTESRAAANGLFHEAPAVPLCARAGRDSAGRVRAGRALVECVVSMFLLAVVALAAAANTRGTLALADDAALVTRAQAMAVSRAEDALTVPCATTASGADQRPRLSLQWQQRGSGSGTLVHIDLTLDRSPIAMVGNASMLLSVEGGGVCP